MTFAEAAPGVQDDIDDAYHAKYDRYGPQIVGSVVGSAAHRVSRCGSCRGPAGSDQAIAISETARKNHEQLFPGHVSTLAVTDPELIEVFDNFAFDEALRHDTLAAGTRLLVQLAGLIVVGALAEYRVMLGAALTNGVTAVEVRELVYQAVSYVGMGRVFEFLHAPITC